MDAARGARADEQVAAEAEGLHRLQYGLDTAIARMEGAIDIDIEHQVVSELAEALAEEEAAPVVGLDSAEGEGHLLTGRADGGFPAAWSFDDRRPAGLSEPEVEEGAVYLTIFLRQGKPLRVIGLVGNDGANAQAEAGASALRVGMLEIFRMAVKVDSAELWRLRISAITGLMTQPAKIGYHESNVRMPARLRALLHFGEESTTDQDANLEQLLDFEGYRIYFNQ